MFTSRDTHEITHVEHTLSVGFLQILHHGRLFFIILRGKLNFLLDSFQVLDLQKKSQITKMSEHDEEMKPGEQIDMIVDSFPNVGNVKQAERQAAF